MELSALFAVKLSLIGLSAGFIAGLLGMGGGIIIVPFLFWTFLSEGVDESLAIHVAIGTSLGVVIFSSLSGALAHYRRGNVAWQKSVRLAATGVPGSILGAVTASSLSAGIMRVAFGILLTIVAARMFIEKDVVAKGLREDAWIFYVIGLAMGFASSLFGIGGGVVAVPMMVAVCGLPVLSAVGNSIAAIFFLSVAGTATYAVLNPPHDVTLPMTIGYINVPAWLSIAAFAMIAANLGARVATAMHGARLRRVFAVVLALVGLKMISGVSLV